MQKGGGGIRGKEQMKEEDHGKDESDACVYVSVLSVSEDEM